MMDYDEFSNRFLAALYLETEQTGSEYHSAGEILAKYGLSPKPHWISRIAEDFKDEIEISNYLNPKAENLDAISKKLAPASDRFVSIGDNSSLAVQISNGVKDIEDQISSSNELDPEEKSDTLISLGLARKLFDNSTRVLVGAFRYLVVERLKKAFEKTIEDAFRLSILAILSTLVAAILIVI